MDGSRGEGEVPEAKDFHLYNGTYDAATSAMLFGTFSITDTTPGDFSIANSVHNSLHTTFLRSPCFSVLHSGLIFFSDGTEDAEYGISEVLDFEANIKMSSDTWRPIPFAVCVGDVFTPEYPDGNPEIYDADNAAYLSGADMWYAGRMNFIFTIMGKC